MIKLFDLNSLKLEKNMQKFAEKVSISILLAISMLLVTAPSLIAQTKGKAVPIVVEIVIDSSQKMKTKIGEQKISDILIKQLPQFFESLPSDVSLAVRTFGHRTGTRQKTKSCQDTELIHPLAKLKSEQLANQIEKLNTKGYSPLAYSIKKIPSDLPNLENNKLILILITASADSCNGNSAAATKLLKSKNTDMSIYAVNLFGDVSTKNELLAITETADSGKVFDVTKPEEMKTALNDLSKEISDIYNETKSIATDKNKDDNGKVVSSDKDKTSDNKNDNVKDKETNSKPKNIDATPFDEIEDLSGTDSISEGESDTQNAFSVFVYEFASSSLFIYLMIGLAVVVILAIVTKIIVGRKKEEFPMEEQVIPVETSGQSDNASPTSDENLAITKAPEITSAATSHVATKLPVDANPSKPQPLIKTIPESPATNPEKTTEPTNSLKIGDIKLPKFKEKDSAVSLDRMIEPKLESPNSKNETLPSLDSQNQSPPEEPPTAGGIKITPM